MNKEQKKVRLLDWIMDQDFDYSSAYTVLAIAADKYREIESEKPETTESGTEHNSTFPLADVSTCLVINDK